ncbi:OLC1v1007208C1 [Oldenlandia corymbosa var. corymbosa]|uniref:OLC1v1007208C1 n=1 Tax=Oldenlandia corymbosa var. corymbosa TaxID=529605 RepID=A0AAV1DIS3_OLDCO|nr:OLC1v1007208C1 [Oldenlandia corymbosa var. corymbosa]
MAKVLDSNSTKPVEIPQISSVFDPGNLSITSFKVENPSTANGKTKPLFIVAPTEEGSFPVLLFLHGYMCANTVYTQLLQHIASHGFVIVAPQLYTSMFTKLAQEIADVAAVTSWMSTELQSVLPEAVKIDLTKVGLVGHSRGGNAAFCLALGKAESSLHFSALMGIDPTAGYNTLFRTKPNILNYIPRSFDLEIPVGVIGTGLGSQQKNFLMPPCAPEGVNHAEFFNECKPPCCYFLAKEYGHMSILDDGAAKVGACFCKGGSQPKYLMRKGVGGIVVAFMKAYLKVDEADLVSVTNNPKAAPITLDPIIYIPA